MKIVEFAFIAYPVTNLERSCGFYEGVLGLRRSASTIRGHEFWVEYEVGPHTLGIGNEPFMKPSPDGAQLVLEVEDFDAAVAHLKAHRVEFAHEPFVMPRCRAAIIMDPDGNRIGIHKRAPA
ncbi:MAG TPA: VOC family protein [Verrucomicrobiota bacterium]|nr:VOC family protein [Verrucomicrobiota bacterium]